MSNERSEKEQSKDAGYEQRPLPEAAPRKPAPEGGIFSQSAILQSMDLLGEPTEDAAVWNAETAQSAEVKAHGGFQQGSERAQSRPARRLAAGPAVDAQLEAAPPPDEPGDEAGPSSEASRQLAADFRSAAEIRLARMHAARESIGAALEAVEGDALSQLRALVEQRRQAIGAAFADARPRIEAAAERARQAIRRAHDGAGTSIRSETTGARETVHARVEAVQRREAGKGGVPSDAMGNASGAGDMTSADDAMGDRMAGDAIDAMPRPADHFDAGRALSELDRQVTRALSAADAVRDSQLATVDDSAAWASRALDAAEADALGGFDALAALHGARIGRAVASRRAQAEAALGAFFEQWSGHVRDAVDRIAVGEVNRSAELTEGLAGLDGLARAAETYADGTARACRGALDSVLTDIAAALDRAVDAARDEVDRVVEGAEAAFDGARDRARDELNRLAASHRAVSRRLARDQ